MSKETVGEAIRSMVASSTERLEAQRGRNATATEVIHIPRTAAAMEIALHVRPSETEEEEKLRLAALDKIYNGPVEQLEQVAEEFVQALEKTSPFSGEEPR